MLRGYRSIVVAAFGCLAFCGILPNPDRAEAKEKQSQREIESSLQRIADALEEANEPQRTEAECADETEDRQSDLCAQWKAADAAAKAADAADKSNTLGFWNLLTTITAMAAAIAAAAFTWRGARAAEDAYTSFQKSEGGRLVLIFSPDMFVTGEKGKVFAVHVANCGRTAVLVKCAFFSQVIQPEQKWGKRRFQEFSLGMMVPADGKPYSCFVVPFLSWKPMDLIGYVDYVDTFGKDHRSHFSIVVDPTNRSYKQLKLDDQPDDY